MNEDENEREIEAMTESLCNSLNGVLEIGASK